MMGEETPVEREGEGENGVVFVDSEEAAAALVASAKAANEPTPSFKLRVRKAVAVSNIDLLARNVKSNIKADRRAHKLQEDALRLQRAITESIDLLQKPALGIHFTRIPYIAHSAVAVEGLMPGEFRFGNGNGNGNGGSSSSSGGGEFIGSEEKEELLSLQVECCLSLSRTLVLRADAMRDAARELEVRGGVRMSGLDIAQRRGDDLEDLMEDVCADLCRQIQAKESSEGGGGKGGKKKSIFADKASKVSSLMNLAMAAPATTDGEDHHGEEGEEHNADEELAHKDKEESITQPLAITDSQVASQKSPKGKSSKGKGPLAIKDNEAAQVVLVPLSVILPPMDADREVRQPVSIATARTCVQFLSAHRALTLMWAAYALEAVSDIVKRRGADPHYPRFRPHDQHALNHTPFWITQGAARVAQLRGRMYQGLCIYYKATEEYNAYMRLTKRPQSRKLVLEIVKLQLAQGNFMVARNLVHQAIRSMYGEKHFPGVDLSDLQNMPEPIDLLRIDKELALLYALTEVNVQQLQGCGLFNSAYSRFLSVQDNGLLTGPAREPVEVERGLTPHKVSLIKERQGGEAAALKKEQAEREDSRELLRARIAEVRNKAIKALAAVE